MALKTTAGKSTDDINEKFLLLVAYRGLLERPKTAAREWKSDVKNT